jgi:Fe-S-cluster containining protein
MSGEYVFECLRCGRCCTDLLVEDREVLRGLTLLPKEVTAFPGSMVKPAVGLGRRPHEKGFTVIAYQLTEETCPHLEGSLCGIYEERPASCRQFPLSLRRGPNGEEQVGLDLNCPALQGILEDNRSILRFEERAHAEKLMGIQEEASRRPGRAWHLDLETGRWVRYKDMPSE